MAEGVVIVGGGLAAQRCCETLRSRDYEGSIRIVCEEDRAPYDRPPLSKGVLAGDRPDDLSFRPSDWYSTNDVDLLTGERAVALDPGIKTITLASGSILRYDSAVVATGSRPRELPGTEAQRNAHTLRTAEDSIRLRDALRVAKRLIVVGAGFIGLEVAATARKMGVEVTVLETAPAPLMRVLVPELANWFADMHRSEGVDLLLSAHVARFGEGANGIEWVQLTDGRRLECDAVVIGIGIVPATEWLEGSGLDPGGVRIDAGGCTEAPDVFAAGDAARVFNPITGNHDRSEQWEAAARQGAQAARSILGLPLTASPLPSFWTDQFGHRVQLVGDAREGDSIEIDGDPEARSFTAVISRDGSIVAGMAVDQPRSIPKLRQRIGEASTRADRSQSEIPSAN